jgi:hypothetical protein
MVGFSFGSSFVMGLKMLFVESRFTQRLEPKKFILWLSEALMPKLLQWLLAAILVSSGTWGILNPKSAPLEVVEIAGSKANPGSSFRSDQNTLGGGDFATYVPGAFVTIRFARTYQFTTVRHSYPFSQFPFQWMQVTAAEIQWSDDGSAWQVADTASVIGETMYFQVEASGAHEWWRIHVTGWAGIPDLLLGNFWFAPADRPFTIPHDIAWALLSAGVLLALLSFGALTKPRLLSVVTAVSIAFVLSYALLLAPYQIVAMNDSLSYVFPVLNATYDSLRSVGYPTFVWLVHSTVGLNNIAVVHLLVQLLALAVLAFVVAHCYGPYTGLATILGGTVLFGGWMVYYAPYVLIESATTASLLLAAAGLVGAARNPSTRMFVLAGGGLALATLSKSTGIAVALGALPIVRFLPSGMRGRGVLLVVAPAVAAYIAMSAHHYARVGVFAPEVEGGIVLAGHVGWMLDGDLPDRPGLIEKLKDAVRPSIAGKLPTEMKITSLAKLDDYVEFTTEVEAWVLWGRMVPALQEYAPGISMVDMHRVFMRVAVASIAANPLIYLRHVAAHFYGMWRQVGLAWIDLRTGSLGFRSAYELHGRGGPFITLLGAPFSAEKVRQAARQQGTVRLASVDVLDLIAPRLWWLSKISSPIELWARLRAYVAIGIGALSLLFCAIVFMPGRLAIAYRGEIMLACMLNAYMLGHAWVVPTIDRFAAPVLPVVFVFVLCLLSATAQYSARTRAPKNLL